MGFFGLSFIFLTKVKSLSELEKGHTAAVSQVKHNNRIFLKTDECVFCALRLGKSGTSSFSGSRT